ncbi:hypothetical protein AB0B50_22640 [Streptomyces sp. NPDC041068]|uniref:hypothetical protein n=1 Tax=Streptomyces sp. NPDC041068 TaxID=3155130 RepID=UPI0033F895DB
MTNSCTRPIATAKKLGVLALVTAAVLSLAQCGSPSGSDGEHGGEEGRPSASAPGGRDDGDDLTELITGYTAGFHEDSGYRRPSRTDRRTVAEGVALLLDHRRPEAERRLSDVDFAVRTVTDKATGRRYAEIADRSEGGAAPRGWGRVYIDLEGPARWSVQVPHPVADQNTERLGAELLRRSPGGILVIAGAHRKAGRGGGADVAHRRDTVFHAICAELARRGLPGVQLHGMADDSAPGYDVVASTGSGDKAVREARALADSLKDRGYKVCRAWVKDCPLAGRKNIQGRAAEDRNVPFLHVEFGPAIREKREEGRRAVEALSTVTRGW